MCPELLTMSLNDPQRGIEVLRLFGFIEIHRNLPGSFLSEGYFFPDFRFLSFFL